MNSPTSRVSRPRPTGTPDLELFTLGGVRLVRDGIEETSRLGAKHLALLIYLQQEGRPMHPSEVTELLGRGQSDEKELEALKRAVGWLRENVPAINIRVTADTLEVVSGAWLDTREVDRAIDVGDWATVKTLYRGEFLEGFESGAPAFDEWAQRERGRLWRAWSNAIVAAAGTAEERGAWEDAAEWWKVLVTRAPMRAEAIAGLLRAYAEAGRGDDARRAFADYEQRLQLAGMAEPAAAVKRVIAEYALLKDVAGAGPVVTPEVAEPAAPADDRVSRPASDGPIQEWEGGDPAVGEPEAGTKEEAPAPLAGGQQSPGDETDRDTEWEGLPDLDVAEPRPEPDEPEGAPVSGGAGDAVSPTTRPAAKDEGGGKPETVERPPQTGPDAPASREADRSRSASGPRAGRGTVEAQGAAQPAGVGGAFVDTGFRGARGGQALGMGFGSRRRRRGLGSVVAAPFRRVLGAARGAIGGRSITTALRRFWYVPAAIIVIALSVTFAPRLLAFLGFAGDSDAASDVQTAMPDLSLPQVDAPKITLRTPAFVETSVSRIGAMLSGPILEEPGRWLVVADVAVEDAADVAVEDVADVAVEDAAPSESLEALPPLSGGDPTGATQSDAPVGEPEAATGAVTTDTVSAEVTPVDTAVTTRGDGAGVRAPPTRTALAAPQEGAGDQARPAAVDAAGTPASGQAREEDTGSVFDADDGDPGRSTDLAISSAVLTLGLETDLRQSRFFHVVPRERALVALRERTGRHTEELSVGDALTVAAAEGYAAVLSARVLRYASGDSVELRVLGAGGDTLYGVAAEVPMGSRPFETLAGLSRAVRRRLGEAGDKVENSLLAAQILSTAPGALVAYAQARKHLFAGRYHQAVVAAKEAIRRDSTFAMAYRALAESYALLGQRERARRALESAWQLSGRISHRERLRILADRHAWDGRLREAILAYDDLFSRYRDDVAALRSQAIVQRMLGVRGAGEGNLRVAYTIDPHDWPPLSRTARYLGYQGELPDVDSLVAAIRRSR